VVYLDTLHLSLGAEGILQDAGGTDTKKKKILGLTLHDKKSKDIEFYPVLDRTSARVKDALVKFGGTRDGILRVVCDDAPDF